MGRARLDALAAIALTVAGELEVLLGAGTAGERLAGALALPVITLPLALRRRVPALPLAAIALALPPQAALGGLLVEQGVIPLAALILALYSAGRHVTGARALVVAAVAIAAITATRLALDPAAGDSAEAFWIVAYTPIPLLVGRWLRGQALLRRELEEKGEALERQRERNARHAAEAERMRIATDLESAVADGVAAIRDDARELSSRLAERDEAAARGLAARIAERARQALADVRRILGVLRRDAPPPLAPAAHGGIEPRLAGADDGGRLPGAPDGVRHPAADHGDRVHGALGGGPLRGALGRGRLRGVPDGGRLRGALDRGRLASRRLDGALAILLAIGGAVELAAVAPAGERVAAALTALLVAAPLYWRRPQPIAVVAAVLAAIAVQSAIVEPERFPASGIAAVVCATYTVGASLALRPAVAGLALALLLSTLHSAVVHPDAVAAAVLGGVAVPWVAGRTVRARRELTAELDDKAARLEAAREEEARAAIVAERARVARELHDAVAHSLSVVAIQAAGAAGIAERDPARAARTSALIESVSGDALAELGRLVAPAATDAARPGLAAVDALAQRTRDSGLPVELRVEGEPAALPAGVDLAAFRIVQEALANTAKHARAARACVVVRYERDAVEIEVADDGRGSLNGSAPPTDGGHGLVGMRERVALYDGTLDAGDRPGGGFLVRARLPLNP